MPEEIELSEEQEEALDEVWEDRRKEEESAWKKPHKHAEPEGQAPEQVAAPGKDGDEAEKLLERCKAEGAAVLADVTQAALKRLLREGGIEAVRAAKSLYNETERQAIANSIAAVNATAQLLGRYQVQKRAEKHRGNTS